MQEALTARLLAVSQVAAIADDRLYWVSRPQGSTLPAVVLTTIDDGRPQHLKGFDNGRATRVQADCRGNTYAEARSLAESIITAVAAPAVVGVVSFGRTSIEGPRDLGEQTTNGFVHRQVVDLIIWHRTV